MHSIFSFLLIANSALAVVPADRHSRKSYVDTKLLDLSLSSRALADLRAMPYWKTKTVGDFVRLDREARREKIAHHTWLESEIARDVARRELRLTMSKAELDLWVKDGRIPHPSLLSSISAMPLGPALRRTFEAHGCQTLAEVRRHFLVPMIFALAPLTATSAREMRDELTQLPLPETELVLTLDEARFATGLAEARLGLRAREILLDRGVRTFADLARLPLDEIAARGTVERKTAKQIESLVRIGCTQGLEIK